MYLPTYMCNKEVIFVGISIYLPMITYDKKSINNVSSSFLSTFRSTVKNKYKLYYVTKEIAKQ